MSGVMSALPRAMEMGAGDYMAAQKMLGPGLRAGGGVVGGALGYGMDFDGDGERGFDDALMGGGLGMLAGQGAAMGLGGATALDTIARKTPRLMAQDAWFAKHTALYEQLRRATFNGDKEAEERLWAQIEAHRKDISQFG